jgi:hypothetical protein
MAAGACVGACGTIRRVAVDLGTVAFGAICAAVGSGVTGYLLKRVEHSQQMRHAGELEVLRRRHTDRWDAVREITGLLAAIDHAVDWVVRLLAEGGAASGGHGTLSGRSEFGIEKTRQVRARTRADAHDLGQEFLEAVTTATDAALALFEASQTAPNPESVEALLSTWKAGRTRVNQLASKTLRSPVI